MKRLTKNNHIALIAVLLALLSFILFWQTIGNSNGKGTYAPPPQDSNTMYSTKKYSSEFLNLSLDVPLDIVAEEIDNDIILRRNNAEITISRIATNYDTVKDYVEDLSARNQYAIQEKREYRQDGLEIISGIINTDKTVFIYVDNWVYTLSTSSPELYNDLDLIAESFQYLQ